MTDAPPNLTALIKQRRRWMNGSLVGTFKVQYTIFKVLSCANKHPFYRQLLMFFYMMYLISSFMLQFVIVGATFSSIVIFLDYLLKLTLSRSGSKFL